MLHHHGVDQDTSEEAIAALVDAVRRSPERRDTLVDLLPERISLYAGRSTNATIRIRGYILASFEEVGLPRAALPYVLEELESGRDAYLVAAAAKGLRGLDSPTGQVVPFLFRAIENIRYADDAVTFASYRPRWPVADHTTALREIFRTFAWLGVHARSALSGLETLSEDPDAFSPATRAAIADALDAIRSGPEHTRARDDGGCCAGPAGVGVGVESGRPEDASARSCCAAPFDRGAPDGRDRAGRGVATIPTDIELEDQDGRRLTYGDFFSQRPSIVAFFYSRCNNPSKCSLTITKLARLQEAMRDEGLAGQLSTAAITYDPDYDLPPRMKAYGTNRGVTFDDSSRFLRTRGGFEALQEYFRLDVNFSQALVNRHAIEVFILDEHGRIAATFSRLQWDVHDVLRRARTLLGPRDMGSVEAPG